MLNFYILKQDYLKFEGTERLDLINRLSTNEVNGLNKMEGTKTILTSDKGRFVDVLTLYNFGDFIFSACSFNNSVNVLAHLDKYTIMDDFKPTDLSRTHETIHFFGDSAAAFAKKIFELDITGLKNNDFIFFNAGERHSIIAGNDDAFGGFYFIYSSVDKGYWDEKLFSGTTRVELADSEYEIKRIELGIPAFGKEMSDKTNPLECGMNKYVSFTKGCYIGQEVIARLDAYDKISKHMVGITVTEGADTENAQEYKITADGKECGFVTSLVKDGNAYSGLGFIKTIFLDFKKEYKLKLNNSLIDCQITELTQNKFTNTYI